MRKLCFITVVLVALLALGTAWAQANTPQVVENKAQLLGGREELAQQLLQQGHAEEQVNLLLEFDAQIEDLRREGASVAELQAATAAFNQRLRMNRVAQETATLEDVIQDIEVEAQLLGGREELAQRLLEQGHSEAQVKQLLEFDRQVEQARREGASQQQLRELTSNFNVLLQEKGVDQLDLLGSGWGYHTYGLYLCCLEPAASAEWQMPGSRQWEGWFRATSGDIYWANGYCPHSACRIVMNVSGETDWDYHVAGVQNGFPSNHTAGCGRR